MVVCPCALPPPAPKTPIRQTKQKDNFVATAAPPRTLFDSAVKDLSSASGEARERAFATLHALATDGSHELTCEARYFVGECCLHGRGAPKDPTRAARWLQTVRPTPWPGGLRPSPPNALAQAQFLLGDLYEYGPTPSRALSWYGRAAERGHPLAALCLAEMLLMSGGAAARPKGANYDFFGARQV